MAARPAFNLTTDQERWLCVSIVCAIDGARFAAVAASEQQCLRHVDWFGDGS